MELIDQLRYLIGGYFGVSLIDEYPLKEYVLKDIDEYIKNFIDTNNIGIDTYNREFIDVKDNLGDKVKLQDALLVLNKINASMDLVFIIKNRLKKYNSR